MSTSTIGLDTPQVNARAKVTGRALYTGDLKLPGMLHAKVLRSPHPSARIVSIDTAAARALPGVRVVLTGADAPRAYWGAYAASKAAFDTLLDCYAQETRAISKLRVAIVNPRATRTAMRAKAYPGEDPTTVKPPEVVAARLLALLGEQFASGHRESVNQP